MTLISWVWPKLIHPYRWPWCGWTRSWISWLARASYSLEDDVVFSLFFEFQPLLISLISRPWSTIPKRLPPPDKARKDMTGNEDGHIEFIVEALDHLTEFLDSDWDRDRDGFIKMRKSGLAMRAIAIPNRCFYPEWKIAEFLLTRIIQADIVQGFLMTWSRIGNMACLAIVD